MVPDVGVLGDVLGVGVIEVSMMWSSVIEFDVEESDGGRVSAVRE